MAVKATNADWLALTVEAPLEPDLPIGAERCMFESNFPVDKVSCSYTVLWNAFKRLTSGASADEKSQLFHGTAARVYRLDRPA